MRWNRFDRKDPPPPMRFQQRDSEILLSIYRYGGFLTRRHCSGEGGGVILRPPAAGILYTPTHFITPPHSQRLFSVMGGWGGIKCSGTKKEHKPKLLSPDMFRWGRGLPRERVGAKKFGMPLETREIKLFGRDIPGFCRDISELPEKFEKKNVCVQFLAPKFGPVCHVEMSWFTM